MITVMKKMVLVVKFNKHYYQNYVDKQRIIPEPPRLLHHQHLISKCPNFPKAQSSERSPDTGDKKNGSLKKMKSSKRK
jgi:hypothetical protein